MTKEVDFGRDWLEKPKSGNAKRKRFRAGHVYTVGTGANHISPTSADDAVEAKAAWFVANADQQPDAEGDKQTGGKTK